MEAASTSIAKPAHMPGEKRNRYVETLEKEFGELRVRFREEVRGREIAEANACKLPALWEAQCYVAMSHNIAAKDVQNKAKFCYDTAKRHLSGE